MIGQIPLPARGPESLFGSMKMKSIDIVIAIFVVLGGELADGAVIEDRAAGEHVVAVPREPVEDVFLFHDRGSLPYDLAISGVSGLAGRQAMTARNIAKSYGKLARSWKRNYIFNWLAWTATTCSPAARSSDYGSIRQFAAKHDKYRYDDVDRFSSS